MNDRSNEKALHCDDGDGANARVANVLFVLPLMLLNSQLSLTRLSLGADRCKNVRD
jgi:hypothetical protein